MNAHTKSKKSGSSCVIVALLIALFLACASAGLAVAVMSDNSSTSGPVPTLIVPAAAVLEPTQFVFPTEVAIKATPTAEQTVVEAPADQQSNVSMDSNSEPVTLYVNEDDYIVETSRLLVQYSIHGPYAQDLWDIVSSDIFSWPTSWSRYTREEIKFFRESYAQIVSMSVPGSYKEFHGRLSAMAYKYVLAADDMQAFIDAGGDGELWRTAFSDLALADIDLDKLLK